MKLGALMLCGIAALIAAAPAQSQATPPPCTLVCEPPEGLDLAQCKCVKESVLPPRACALVCLGPGETLDAKQCKCVKSK